MADNDLWTYVKGLLNNPNTEMPAEEVRTPTLSTEWKNRKAKEAAKTLSVDNHLEQTWKEVMRAEGGYVNNPQDPGGETKYGITKRDYPHLDIKNITPEDARAVFKNNYYDAVGGDVLAKINTGLAAHAADMAYNAGPNAAIKLLYDVAGLPRQNKITPALIDSLDSSTDIVKNYSAARLKYYSNLGNAPTFLKGWTNRVRNLNKSLGLSKGMENIYRAAATSDIDSLIAQGDGYRKNTARPFADLTPEEKDYLLQSNKRANPLYSAKEDVTFENAKISDKEKSSLRDVFKATYDQKYYINTASGQEELRRQQINQVFDENFKALQTQLSPEQIKQLGFKEGNLTRGFFDFMGISEAVADNALDKFEEGVRKLKVVMPELKLPYETANQIRDRIALKAKDIERAYGSLESGDFGDGIAATMGKLGHILGGYLPAQILGSLADPIEAATNLIPAGKITQGAGLLKNMAVALFGTGASQTLVQSSKEKLGLEGSLVQGIGETAAATAGVGVLGTLGMGIKKLWSLGSRQTGEQAAKLADDAIAALSKEIPNAETQSLKFALEQSKDLAEQYIKNPYGDSFYAKQKLETTVKNIFTDWSQDLPARDLPLNDIRSFVPYDLKTAKSWTQALDPEEAVEFNQAVKLINDIRKAYIPVANSLDDIDVSVIPVLEEGKIKMFQTEDSARQFIANRGMGEELYIVKGTGDSPFYVAKHVDIEDAASASTRFDTTEPLDIGGQQVKSLASTEDLTTFQQHPTYSKLGAKDFKEATGEVPTYSQSQQVSVNMVEARRLEIEQAMKTSQADLDRAFQASYDRLKNFSTKNGTFDLTGDPEIKTLMDDIDTLKTDLSEVQTCFFGGGEGGT